MGKSLLLIFALVVGFNVKANAWGMRGHQVVCEAAIFSVADENLSLFLRARVPMFASLCNIPDTSWRSKGPEITAINGPTHFIDPEVIGLLPSDIGIDYRKLQIEFEGKDNQYKEGTKIMSLHRELGSVWWRVDQFVRRGLDFAGIAEKAKKPTNRGEEQDDKLAFNQSIYEWMVNVAIMGHFVGDASQPLHSTADYDGYKAGHGGIHSFYEDVAVNHQDERLTLEVIQEARRLLKQAETLPKTKRDPAKNKELAFLLLENPVEKMRALSTLSAGDLPALLKVDKVKKPSSVQNDKGMEIRTAAEREITPKMAKEFRKLQVKHMGRSAALLAQLWSRVYERSGKPDLASYKAYRYPHEPDFIPPDYFDLKLEKKAE